METLSQLVEQLRDLTERGSPSSGQTKTSPVLIPLSQLQKKGGTGVSRPSSAKTATGRGQGAKVAKAGDTRKRKDGTYVKTKEGDWDKVPEKAAAKKSKPKAATAKPAAKKPSKKTAAKKTAAKKPAAAKPKKTGGRAAKAASAVKKKDPKSADDAAKALKKASKGKKPSPNEKKKISDVAGGIAKSIARTVLKGFFAGRDVASGKMKDKAVDLAKKAWQKFLDKIDFVESCHINGQFLFEGDSDEADLVKAMQDAEDPDAMLAVMAAFMEREIRSEIEADPEMGQGADGWEDGDEDDDEDGDDQYPFEPNPSLNPAGW